MMQANALKLTHVTVQQESDSLHVFQLADTETRRAGVDMIALALDDRACFVQVRRLG